MAAAGALLAPRNGGAARPLAGGEVPGELSGGQSIGAEQPAVVGDDLHGPPSGIVLQLMAAVIEVADLQPALGLTSSSFCSWRATS